MARPMDLVFVESFYWVATLKSVSRAAKRVHISQPAMSARIRVLETELGASLLDRRVKRVRLTLAGQQFLQNAERLLEHWRTIKDAVRPGVEERASLRIGVIESVLHSWLVPWLERLRAERPNLEVELTVETTPVVVDLARRGVTDIAVATLPVETAGFQTRALPSMPMVFVGASKLHKRRRYTLKQLAEHGLLTFQRGSQPHAALVDALRRSAIELARIHPVSSISAMLRLVTAGFGVATLPLPAASAMVAEGNFRILPCEVSLPVLPIHASWRTDPSSDSIDAVVESAARYLVRESSRRRSSKKSMS